MMTTKHTFKNIFSALGLFVPALFVNVIVGCTSTEISLDPVVSDDPTAQTQDAICDDQLVACNDELLLCVQEKIAISDACETARQQAMAYYEAARDADIASAVLLCEQGSITAAEILAAPSLIGTNPNLPAWVAGGPPGTFYAVSSVEHPNGSGPVTIVGAFALESFGL